MSWWEREDEELEEDDLEHDSSEDGLSFSLLEEMMSPTQSDREDVDEDRDDEDADKSLYNLEK